MIKVICYQCEAEVVMSEFDAFETAEGVYHKKWKGVCRFSHSNEYIDFTRTFVNVGNTERLEGDGWYGLCNYYY